MDLFEKCDHFETLKQVRKLLFVRNVHLSTVQHPLDVRPSLFKLSQSDLEYRIVECFIDIHALIHSACEGTDSKIF